ncbi:hypothetical protein QQ045_013502 [Rhodiola kirilowii]
MVENAYPVPPLQYNPLDEPSPLGLKLRKSPSLLELIQTHLAHGKTSKSVNSGETISYDNKEGKSSASSSDKLKASNFPASLLKIGNWEYQSRYEGDLVAKCYFAKHKLVWEVLDAGLKSKIEIQWSDITGLKADCPESGESSLKLVLARQPLFFRETNPQPRKHTLWQASFDFTNGEASVNRVHFVKFSQGMLHKHFEKLIQCDSRLNFLSRQPDMMVDPPYFEGNRSSVFEGLDTKPPVFDPIIAAEPALNPGFPNATLPTMASAVQPTFFKIEQRHLGGRILEQLPKQSFSPNSASPAEGFMSQTDEFQVAGKRSMGLYKESDGLRPSMSKLDLVNYLDDMMSPVPDPSSAEAAERKAQLEHLAEILLNDGDSHLPPPTDEKSVMARVNSLCCLLQKDSEEGSNSFKEIEHGTSLNPTTMGANHNKENSYGVFFNHIPFLYDGHLASGGEEAIENPAMKPPTGMMRKDSFSDLLFNLPRIASLPQFLNN